MNIRTVDIYEYMQVLRELTEQGQEVRLLITGNSMAPFLHDRRDEIFFKKPDRELKRGDMVFYQRRTGQYVMHRICHVTLRGYDLIGDAQTTVEPDIRAEQIFGLVTRVRRKGRMLSDGDFWWEFFRCVWIRMIPARKFFMRSYAFFKKI